MMMMVGRIIIMMLMIIGRVKRGRGWGEADTPIISLSLGGQLPFLQCATVHLYILQKYNCIIVQCTLHSALQSRSLHHTVTQCANIHLINVSMCQLTMQWNELNQLY